MEHIRMLDWTDWFRELQQYGLLFEDDEAASIAASATPDTHIVFKRRSGSEIHDWIKAGIPFEIEHIQVFCILRDSCGMIHVDGIDRKCALNIPLRDCHLGIMEWFPKSGFTHKKFASPTTVAGVTNEELAIYPKRWPLRGDNITVVNRPAVIRTNIWHRVDNRGNPQYRYMLSLRFKDNPSFEDVVNHLTGVTK
jgi:hypothetical protein